jgi:hypothetical protein
MAVISWDGYDRSQKRIMLETVRSNCLWDDKQVIPEYRQLFDLIALALAVEPEGAASTGAAKCFMPRWLPR